MSLQFKTRTVEETELIYSILRDRYPDRQIEIEFNDNRKEYTLIPTNMPYKEDPNVPLDVKIKVVYGDSVTGDTPLLLKRNGQIFIHTIESVFTEGTNRSEYPGFKIFDKTIRLEKEYSLSDYQIWTDAGWIDIKKVIRHRCSKKIYRVLTPTGTVDVTEDHSLIRSNLEPVKPGDLEVGDFLLSSFPSEFDCKIDFQDKDVLQFPDKVSAQRAYYIYRSRGLFPMVESPYQLKFGDDRISYSNVTQILDLGPSTEYVYDIETSIGRFGCGVGQLIAFNTDSCFLSIKFNRENFEQNRKDAFDLGVICGNNLTNDVFKRPPIELEFEKVYQPFILLTKKRYIGKKFEDLRDPMKLKTVTTAGIALTRRDYCQMVKRCYKEIIDTVMEGKTDSVATSLDIFRTWIGKIERFEVSFDDLVVSAMLAKNYSCALCKEKTEWNVLRCGRSNCRENNVIKRPSHCGKCGTKIGCLHTFSLGHVNLATTLLQRNEEINVNDRIQYIYIEGDSQKKADLAEDPRYAKEHNLKYNRVCYLEQLAKPILGFYKIVLKDDETLLDDIIHFVNKKLVLFGGKKLRPSDFKIDDTF